MRFARRALLVAAAVAVAFVSPARTQTAGDGLEPLIRRFQTDEQSLNRFYPLALSEPARRRREAFLGEWQTRLEALNYAALPGDARTDYHLLRDHLIYERQQVGVERKRAEEVAGFLPFAGRILTLEEARQRMEPVDPEQAARELTAVGEAAKAAKAEKRKMTPVLALRTANQLRELNGALARWFGYYNGFKPLFTWWCAAPYEAARKELEGYEKHLRETLAGVKGADDDPLIGDPIGRDALALDLRHERIPHSPDDLVKIAEREFAWCEAEMKRAAREMGVGDDWKAALEKVKGEYAPPGEQDTLVAKQARDAIAFVESRDLVTVDPLCKETWRLQTIGPEQQRTLPFAAYGGQRMLVAYPTDRMDHATKMMSLRGNNVAFTRIVTPHELIPGHHLQGFMSDRYRAYRQYFGTPFLVEGWSLYWEMLLWDLKYPETPQHRIGMLFWRMHRCARIIVSLNFHLGKMSPPEMVDYLVNRVGHERFTATSEVRRFIGGAYSPLYQCAYMIGGLQLRELYGELVTTGKMTPKAFHDAVLKENEIPIELIRAALTNQPLPKDAEPAWKF
jgi:hypothetical protein